MESEKAAAPQPAQQAKTYKSSANKLLLLNHLMSLPSNKQKKLLIIRRQHLTS